MKSSVLASLRLTSLLFALPAIAHAHSVWIEDTPDHRLTVRFGDVGGKVEQSPGYLDELLLTAAWTADQDGRLASIPIQKKSDHYLLVGATPNQPALGETNFSVMQRGQQPGIWPNLYIRWHPAGAPAPTEPGLTLDLLPTGSPGEFRLFFRGQPLPGATVKVLGQGSEASREQKLTSDPEGRLRFTPTAPGLVVLTCNHREKIPGYTRGKAYTLASHTIALSWRQP
jgi:hypothetical protein